MSIITFNDIHGAEQTVDLSQEKFNVAFNADCMEFFRACPNNSFSWIVADPPYGDGSSQSVNVERERDATIGSGDGSTGTKQWNRFGQRFDRYKHQQVGQIRGRNNLQALSTVTPPRIVRTW